MVISDSFGLAVRAELTADRYERLPGVLRDVVDGQPRLLVWCPVMGRVEVPVVFVPEPIDPVRAELSPLALVPDPALPAKRVAAVGSVAAGRRAA